MASQLPEKLKKADLHRFATRAAQLEKYRPIITYWCEYYILQQVLGKGLHNGDDECSNYAVQLMDKLESTKADNASNDAILDDVAAKAYIENFALDTFNRGDEAQSANKVTKQTADTFLAAATFMDLLSIWGEVDQEISAKHKFAKYHARRILQAFKAGEDPNATNPAVEEPIAPAEHGLDAELKALESQQGGSENGSYHPPAVEIAPDDGMQLDTDGPPQLPTQPPAVPPQTDYQVSPIEPPDAAESANIRQDSNGGGYFPTIPSAPSDSYAQTPPLQSPQVPMDPQDFYNTNAQPPTVPSAPSPHSLGISNSARPSRPTPDEMAAHPPAIPPVQFQPPPQVPMQHPVAPPPPAPPIAQPQRVAAFNTDDEANMAAQKHARWAISALNFEDVNTAVKELRLALQSLGAG